MTVRAVSPTALRPDHVYQLLVDGYSGMTTLEVAEFHARLILLLINRVGDGDAVADAIAEARRGTPRRRSS